MAVVRSFHGVRYNPSRVGDLSGVICPPYDVISASRQEAYYQQDKYNYIRIEHSRELPGDNECDNKYTRALATLEKWLDEAVLTGEKEPAVYIHRHYFPLEGIERCRTSLIAAVRAEDWDKGIILPHEGTLPKARSDRETLLRTLKANTSPVFVMYEDNQESIQSVLENLTAVKPQISTAGYDNERHEVWVITEPRAVKALTCLFDNRPLYIADGHHRYESALKYRREQAALLSSATGEEPFNFLMMEMVSFTDPGLVILPPHRLIRGVSWQNINSLLPRLEELFDIEEFHLDCTGAWSNIEQALQNAAATSMALFGLGGDRVHVITVKNQANIDRMMPAFHSELYKKLDVSIVDHIILESLLGLTDMTDLSRISFNHNQGEVIELVNSGQYQLAVILRTVKPEIIKTVADAGERMPRKSTYFHPKLPSGLVMNRLV